MEPLQVLRPGNRYGFIRMISADDIVSALPPALGAMTGNSRTFRVGDFNLHGTTQAMSMQHSTGFCFWTFLHSTIPFQQRLDIQSDTK